MNREDAIKLARIAAGARPQQRWDDATPDVWALALDDIRVEDATEALKVLVKAAAFIDLPVLRAEVKRMRDDRIARNAESMPEYPGDPDDVAGYQAWLRSMLTAIADGKPVQQAAIEAPAPRALPNVARLLPSVPAGPKDERAVDERRLRWRMPPRPPAEVEDKRAQALEAERKRQLLALESAMQLQQQMTAERDGAQS